ncbi:DUF3592 domain-containing protein [Actinocorallia sp. B10E7]|uniref:DUF3592 domain-containing protein n=1 Tax=Actinocorallia sp. B10E7 TaxID=3153558 RepID=UPI00325F3948
MNVPVVMAVVLLGLGAAAFGYPLAGLIGDLVRKRRARRISTVAPEPGRVLEKRTEKVTKEEELQTSVRVRFFTIEGREVTVWLPVKDPSSVRGGTARIKYDPADPTRAVIDRRDDASQEEGIGCAIALMIFLGVPMGLCLYGMVRVLLH